MKITIGNSIFHATLSAGAATSAFTKLLPLTLDMRELNQNEKYADLGQDLPTGASPGGAVKSGEIMLYGNSTLVLFYENFQTSYSYTRIGKIDDAVGLKAALGSGSATVKFERD